MAWGVFHIPQLFQKKARREVQAGWKVVVTGKKATAVASKKLIVNLSWSKG
jgi:hypothetical protein